jgi:hypothetical protein
MKFTTIIRTQMMLVAMVAAGLFLASSAYAQQDMDPTTFPDGPFVTNFAPSNASANALANNAFTMDATNTAAQTAVNSNDEAAVAEAGVAEWTPVDVWLTTALTMVLGMFSLYGALQNKRDRKQITFGPRTLSPSNATAR